MDRFTAIFGAIDDDTLLFPPDDIVSFFNLCFLSGISVALLAARFLGVFGEAPDSAGTFGVIWEFRTPIDAAFWESRTEVLAAYELTGGAFLVTLTVTPDDITPWYGSVFTEVSYEIETKLIFSNIQTAVYLANLKYLS